MIALLFALTTCPTAARKTLASDEKEFVIQWKNIAKEKPSYVLLGKQTRYQNLLPIKSKDSGFSLPWISTINAFRI